MRLRESLQNMSFTIFLILILLSISMSLIVYTEVSVQENPYQSIEVDGFLTYAANPNGQGKINISKDDIIIEAMPSSQPRVIVYASTADFRWNFSVTPIDAVGDSHPVAFSVDWEFGKFIVWGHQTIGWYYNLGADSKWNSSGTSLRSTLTLGCRYAVAIEWQELSETVNLIFSISNSTWQRELFIEVVVPSSSNIEYSSLYLEAWANSSGHTIARFDNSKFVSYSSAKFTQETPFSIWTLVAVSIVVWAVTILVLIAKLWRLPPTIRSVRKFWVMISWNNIRGLIKGVKSSITPYRVALLLFLLFGGLRIALAAVTDGHLFDTYATKTWLNIIESKGIAAIYPFSDILSPYLGLRPVFPYPPIIAYILYLIPSLPAQESLASILMKLPSIIADLLLGFVVFATFKNREGLALAIPALFLSLLNIVNSSIWGQYDSIVSLFMVLSVWLVATERVELGWTFMALAISTKQAALVLLPGLLVLSIKQKQWSRLFYGLLVSAGVFFIVWYPFLQSGLSLDFAVGASGLSLWSPGGGLDPIFPEGGGGTSIWAFNMWPIITSALNGQPTSLGIVGAVKDTLPNQFFALSYFQLGIILFGLVYGVVAIRILKASNHRDVMLQFGLLMLAFYMLPTRIHERYLIFALSFLPFVYNKSKVVVGSYLVLLVTYSLSLGYSLLGGPWRSSVGVFSPLVNGVFSEYGLSILCATNVLVFLSLILSTSNILARVKLPHLQ